MQYTSDISERPSVVIRLTLGVKDPMSVLRNWKLKLPTESPKQPTSTSPVTGIGMQHENPMDGERTTQLTAAGSSNAVIQ